MAGVACFLLFVAFCYYTGLWPSLIGWGIAVLICFLIGRAMRPQKVYSWTHSAMAGAAGFGAGYFFRKWRESKQAVHQYPQQLPNQQYPQQLPNQQYPQQLPNSSDTQPVQYSSPQNQQYPQQWNR